MSRLLRTIMAESVKKVPIPRRGVDYRGKVVLAPMVRSGELPSRLLALHYGADLVWGPETVDRSMIGTTRRVNPTTGVIEWTRPAASNHAGTDPNQQNIIYRMHPKFETGRKIFQLGTADPERAVAAARLVAADVSGIDVNAGCPKPFSTSGGMGAALLKTPDVLASILEALVREIVPEFEVAISVKIRLLETPAETEALVRRLLATGIAGLTVHCRTTPMRKRQPVIRGQLRMVSELCREAGVACLMNGDIEDRDSAAKLVEEFGVDGAMIATAAERNPSCFRTAEEGGMETWDAVVRRFVETAIEVQNRIANTKYLLTQMIPGKRPEYMGVATQKSYEGICMALGHEDLLDRARDLDAILGLEIEAKKAAKAKAKQKNASTAQAAGGNMAQSRKAESKHRHTLSDRGVPVVPDATPAAASLTI